VAELALEFPVLATRRHFAYQIIAEKASQLHRLGMSACAIARALGVTDKTVTKALRSAREGLPRGAQ
jgi:DNA invertase Pin-like site-specific DNA recombinase